jgi:CPA2 family monovalent cation:H+ antiporter-2
MGSGAGSKKLEDHTIVVGYGMAGRNLVRALNAQDIAFMVVEYDPLVVRQEKRAGLNIMYGDASRPEVLNHAGLSLARNIVFTISDPEVLLAAVEMAHRLNPAVNIIARARRTTQVDSLKERGARFVITEEISGSVAISSEVLTLYSVPDAEVEETVGNIHNSK